MNRTLLALGPLLALVACGTDPLDDTPIDGSVEVSWQVGASGCELAGVTEVMVVAADREATAPCLDGSLILDVPAGDHVVTVWGLDALGAARYEATTRASLTEGEALTLPTVVLGALPATLDVSWYFDNGRLCGGNGVAEVDIIVFQDDFIVGDLTTDCDDGIEPFGELLAGDYTVSVLARDADGAVAFAGAQDVSLDKGDQAVVEVLLAP
jgi:hypothetical protein